MPFSFNFLIPFIFIDHFLSIFLPFPVECVFYVVCFLSQNSTRRRLFFNVVKIVCYILYILCNLVQRKKLHVKIIGRYLLNNLCIFYILKLI